MGSRIAIDRERLAEVCRKWRIRELCFFGSVLREDFRQDSDVDVMVAFEPDAHWGLLAFSRMQEELGELLGRDIDLTTRDAVEGSRNYIRRTRILKEAQVIHAR